MNLKYGCDPEFFSVVDVDGKDFVVSPALLEKDSGLQFIYQDEEEKHPVYLDNKNFHWMMDGVAWELTLKSPQENWQGIYYTVNESLVYLNQFLSNFKWMDKELKLYKKPVININPDWYVPYLDNYKIYQGFIFGCDPDEDAIVTEYVCKTLDVLNHKFRYGGGHIHISGLEEFKRYPQPAIQFLACTVGNYVIANSPYPKLEKQRSKTYGRPGRFRKQNYKNGEFGVEYRTPSNSWCSYTPEKMEELFDWVNVGCKFLQRGRGDIISKYLNETIKNIENSNQENANQILDDLRKEI